MVDINERKKDTGSIQFLKFCVSEAHKKPDSLYVIPPCDFDKALQLRYLTNLSTWTLVVWLWFNTRWTYDCNAKIFYTAWHLSLHEFCIKRERFYTSKSGTEEVLFTCYGHHKKQTSHALYIQWNVSFLYLLVKILGRTPVEMIFQLNKHVSSL